MTDEELAAEDRRAGLELLRLPGALERYAGGLLKESADRLEDRATAQSIGEALAGIERALELGETAWALKHVRLTLGRLALAEGVQEYPPGPGDEAG